MKQYPNSIYASKVSDMVAVAKARNFGDYATSYDYNQAMSYAKDSYTRNTVQSYISMNKKKQKDRKRLMKSLERDRNGGTVNLGLGIDIATNGFYDDATIRNFNVGLSFRIGNFKDWIQLAFCIAPGMLDGDDDYYTDTSFHMPISGQLKLNIIKTSIDSRVFVYGQYQYNAVRIEEAESEMAWSAGIGLAWKHCDWSFYYRQDIGRPSSWDYDKQHYFGMSLIYYWQL
jgi:hypothetical protein